MRAADTKSRRPDHAEDARGLPRASAPPCPRAFTLIELLVVIVIIGVLTALVLTIATGVVGHQRRGTTENTMRLVRLAIDQFENDDPLSSTYDNPKLRDGRNRLIGQTFGPFPPYQLKYNNVDGNVADALEAYHPLVQGKPARLSHRLTHDLSGRPDPVNEPEWVHIDTPTEQRKNDDIRSLYAYLAAFTPSALTQIPDSAKGPIKPGTQEFINPTHSALSAAPGTPGGEPWVSVLGIFDAWGVPLDYFLQVKLEFGVPPDGGPARWKVADRVPVLRSRGVSKEIADAEDAQSGRAPDPQKWIFSEPFPRPAAPRVAPNNGQIRYGYHPNDNGWARAVADGDNYNYVPEN